MGVWVSCPACPNTFPIHGYEQVKRCFNCGTLFNPQRSPAQERA